MSTTETTFRELSDKGTATLKTFEGVIPFVYDDSVAPPTRYKRGAHVGGTLTGGVGHVGADLQQWIGKAIPKATIDQWLDADTDTAEKAVDRLVQIELTDTQADTLFMFVFNVGVSAFAGSTLLKKINKAQTREDLDAAIRTQLPVWNKTTINGKKVTSKGLVNRRAAEVAYWFSDGQAVPKPPADASVPMATEVAEPSSQRTTTFEWGGLVVGAITGLGSFANADGILGIAIAVAIVVAVAVGAAIIVRRQFFPA